MRRMILILLLASFFIPTTAHSQTIADRIGQFAHDEVSGVVKEHYDKVWSNAQQVLGRRGRITRMETQDGELVAIIENSRVRVEVIQADDHTNLEVSARHQDSHQPDLELAQKLYDEIAKAR